MESGRVGFSSPEVFKLIDKEIFTVLCLFFFWLICCIIIRHVFIGYRIQQQKGAQWLSA